MIMRKITLGIKLIQLEELTKRIERLQKQVNQKKFITDEILQKAIERYLQLAIEAMLDIASHIIGEMGFEKAENYKENFEILAREGILPHVFAKKIKSAAGFRNILVHDYVDIDAKKVYEHFKNDGKDIKKFLKHIVQWLKKEKKL